MIKLTITGTAKDKQALKPLFDMLNSNDLVGEFVIEEESPRWRAAGGGDYWVVSDNGFVKRMIEYAPDSADRIFSNVMWTVGNYFRTKGEAEAAAERVRAAYRGQSDV